MTDNSKTYQSGSNLPPGPYLDFMQSNSPISLKRKKKVNKKTWKEGITVLLQCPPLFANSSNFTKQHTSVYVVRSMSSPCSLASESKSAFIDVRGKCQGY